jgi:hypothetical protein
MQRQGRILCMWVLAAVLGVAQVSLAVPTVLIDDTSPADTITVSCIDLVCVMDNGAPTITIQEGGRLSLTVHVGAAITNNASAGVTVLEADGSLSDFINVAALFGSNTITLDLCSETETVPCDQIGGPTIVEDGMPQLVLTAAAGPQNIEVRFASDVSETAAIPEPATWLLLATGFLRLLGYGWRQRKQRA